ncbi:MAG TPA: hypothetical protein VG847_00970 [Chitinophagaceae bacterium]|nr:hypothetical protein [Chitinophagaceae bacterium]
MKNEINFFGVKRHPIANSSMDLVVLPKKAVSKIEQAVTLQQDLVDEKQAQDVLGITKKTLGAYCRIGKIPRSDYTTAVTGRRFFWLQKLLGLRGTKRNLKQAKEEFKKGGEN